MSKTVKRVMTVMLMGLVAMLGAKAEAHWIVVKGTCFWHSGECVRKDKDPPPDPIPNNPAPLGELRATPTSVEILCPNGDIIPLSDDSVELVAQRPIVQADFTKATKGGSTTSNAEWTVIVSDAHFLEDPTSCANSIPPSPLDVIVRAMSVTMNLYDCVQTNPPTPCPGNQKPHSAWKATCTLPNEFKLKNYPKKFPPRGARYDCSGTERCHEGNTPLCEPL